MPSTATLVQWPFFRTTWLSQHPKDLNKAREDGMAVASAGPYANNLQLAPDRQPHQHLITHFFTGRMLFLMPN